MPDEETVEAYADAYGDLARLEKYVQPDVNSEEIAVEAGDAYLDALDSVLYVLEVSEVSEKDDLTRAQMNMIDCVKDLTEDLREGLSDTEEKEFREYLRKVKSLDYSEELAELMKEDYPSFLKEKAGNEDSEVVEKLMNSLSVDESFFVEPER